MKTRVAVGPFHLVEQIGFGGMAEVWRAESDDGRSVAAKIMTGTRAFDSRYQARFVREVQAVASLSHPGIVRVFDHGKVENGEGAIRTGSPFLIMELADRGTMEEVRASSFRELRETLVQLLDALAYAHARGVVHRDIKPANVLLASSSTGLLVKLSDFGIAHADDPDAEVTRSSLGEAAGTPQYMPPEQLEGTWRRFGPWTDLYAVGCMAWELTTGEVPFHQGSPIQIAFGHLSEPLPDFEPTIPVPEGFEAWLRRLLEKDPADRFQRAADAAFELQRLQSISSWSEPSSNAWVAPSTSSGLEEGSDDYDDYVDDDETMVMSFDDIPEQASGLEELSEEATTVLDADEFSWVEELATERAYPPIPRTWRRARQDRESTIAMGLGLFGLRETPFIGREAERDMLWDALRDVDSTGSPRVVILEGPSGTGKSRTAEWISLRAEELGGGTFLRAEHGPAPTPKHGLGHMLSRHFVSWRIDEFEAVQKHVKPRLERLWRDEDLPVHDFLEHESAAVAAIVAPRATREDGGEPLTLSADERLATVQRVIERIAASRPVILWVDDAQWADEAVALVARIVDRKSLPVLCILTVQTDAEPTDGARALLERVRKVPKVQSAKIGYLPAAEQRELVRRLAGLAPQTADRVVASTGGNPLLAVQLVGHWVQAGALRPSTQGYVVGSDIDMDEQLHGLWQRRVESVLRPLGGQEQVIAVELAAVLGDDVLEVEWQGTCIVAGIHPDDRLIEVLVDNGLAHRFEGGWSFVHKMVADGMRAEARYEGRWQQLNGCCAEVLRTIYSSDNPTVARRLAAHSIAAGNPGSALAPLQDATEAFFAAGDLAEVGDCLEDWEAALELLELDADDPRHLDYLLNRALLEMRSGDPSAAAEYVARALPIGQRVGDTQSVALAYRLKGELAGARGRFEEALGYLEAASKFLEAGLSSAERAAFYESRAWVYKSLGRPADARKDLEAALDLRREAGDAVREVNVFQRLATTFLAEGHAEAAREVAEMGIELGKQLGNRGAEAGCWMALGEVERAEKKGEQARYCYGEAERLDELSGSRHVWRVRTAIALMHLEEGDWSRAETLLRELHSVVGNVGYGWLLPTVEFGLATTAGARGDWEKYDEFWASAIERAEATGMVERDFAVIAELAGDVAQRVGDFRRSQDALRQAMRMWNAVGDAWKAREARIKIRSVSRSG